MTAALAAVGQATEDALGPGGHLGRAEVLQPQVEPAV